MTGGDARPDGARLDAAAFERLVVEELDRLPDAMVEGLQNVAFVTEDEPGDGENLLGRYDGIDLTRRDQYGFGELPDRIVLFRLPLLAATTDEQQLRAEVRTTLIHEIGHYYGLDDDRLHELGWAWRVRPEPHARGTTTHRARNSGDFAKSAP